MALVEYACGGKLLFSAEPSEPVPRLSEVVIVDDQPYRVVDVEYWARRHGATERRSLSVRVYLERVGDGDWALRQARRSGAGEGTPSPKRY